MELTSLHSHPQSSQHLLLLIDDDEINREVIAQKLKAKGYTVVTANDGLEGLNAVKTYKPDLIICDVNMPTMNGHELIGILKTDPEFSGIPFIFLTSNKESSDIRKGMSLGADDYLSKSFETEELYAAVKTRLDKKKSVQKYYETQFDDIKNSIVSFLPHEFRTPLNSILGFSEMMFENSALPQEEIKDISLVINRSANRLQHLLENLVLFGQLQFWVKDREMIEKLRKESETIISDIIQSVVETHTVKYERVGAVHISIQNEILQISSVHLTKIVDEIIDNALKFSHPGSIVTITSEDNDTLLQIIVRDEGRGMSIEQINKISAFQQFERNYYEQQGAGLGLVIATILTEIYDGKLTIISEEKKGTTVKISLPKAKN